MVRLVNRRTGSVAVVPDEKAAALSILGFEPEGGKPKKAPAKAAAKKAPAKAAKK